MNTNNSTLRNLSQNSHINIYTAEISNFLIVDVDVIVLSINESFFYFGERENNILGFREEAVRLRLKRNSNKNTFLLRTCYRWDTIPSNLPGQIHLIFMRIWPEAEAGGGAKVPELVSG